MYVSLNVKAAVSSMNE